MRNSSRTRGSDSARRQFKDLYSMLPVERPTQLSNRHFLLPFISERRSLEGKQGCCVPFEYCSLDFHNLRDYLESVRLKHLPLLERHSGQRWEDVGFWIL